MNKTVKREKPSVKFTEADAPAKITIPEPVATPTPLPNSTIRPGISDEMLKRAGIERIDAATAFARTGQPYSGLWIPYHNLDGSDMMHAGKPFGRIRMDVPTDKQKYHQEYGFQVRAYLSPGLMLFPKGAPVYLIEGEFKAPALVEAGYLAVGLGGIYGFGRQKSAVLLEEVKAVLDHFQPKLVYFVGDSDMCTNFQFSDAAIKLHNLIK